MINTHLIYFSMILLLGTIVSALAEKLKVPNTMFLTFVGMILGGFGILFFPEMIVFISTISIILVVFDSTVRLKFKDIEKFSSDSMKLVIIFFITNLLIMTLSVFLLFNFPGDLATRIILSLIFVFIMYGIDHDVTLGKSGSKVHKLAEIESLLNRALTLVLPLIVLNYLNTILFQEPLSVLGEWGIYFKQIFLGLLIGGSSGIAVLSILNAKINERVSYLIALTSCTIVYVFSEFIGSNGILALTVFALILGNFHLKHRQELKRYISVFEYVFNIFVYILIGTVLLIDFKYIMKGTFLFILYLASRFIAVQLALRKSKYSFKEKLFLTFNIPKGIDVAIIILMLMTKYSAIPGIDILINLSLLFCLYSIIVSNITNLFAKKLIECH